MEINWLSQHGVNCINSDSRNKLSILKEVYHEKDNVLNKIIMKQGHHLYLPPYHHDLHLTELFWGEIKGEVAHKNISTLYL